MSVIKLSLAVITLFCLTSLSYVDCASQCYSCAACSDPWTNATTFTNCTSGSDTCVKTAIRWPGGAFIARGCVPSNVCHDSTLSIAGFGYWLSCCATDLCNGSTITRANFNVYFLLSLFLTTVIVRFF